MTDEEIRQLADLGVQQIELRLAVLNQVIREAQADGDDRWQDLAREQAQPLNDALAIAKSRARAWQEIPEPQGIVIRAKVGQMGARGRG